jgi:hypothetical protein
MYYDEKIINGIYYWRNTPDGKWKMKAKDLPTLIGNIVLSK